MPANMFNKHNKDNTLWYPDLHSKDGNTSYRKAIFKTASLWIQTQFLSDIPRKLNKSGRWFLSFILFCCHPHWNQKTKNWWEMKTKYYLMQAKNWVQRVTVFSGLFISVYNEDSQLDFSEQLYWGLQQSSSLIFPQAFWLFCAEGNKAVIRKWTK